MFDTVIIGAGIAGLAAADYLKKNSNHNFIILESFLEIGGRIQTMAFDNKLFSIGPGWVHGKEGNPIYDIFLQLGISMELEKPFKEASIFAYDTDKRRDITQEFVDKRKSFDEIMENIMIQFDGHVIESEKSYREILNDNFRIYDEMSDLEKTVLYTDEIYFGTTFDEVSAFSEISYEENIEKVDERIEYRILDPLGCRKFIDYLASGLKDKIKLNCRVKTIEWSPYSDPVLIISSDGQQFSCKNAIITVQSDLLAKQSITFIPPLPKEKVRAWKHVPAVNYCRVFAKFPHKFWPDKEWLIPVIKDVDPINELILWQNCASQHLCDEEDNILICHYTSGYKNGSSRFDVDRDQLTELVAQSMKNMFPLTYCKPCDVLFVSHWNSERFSGSFSIPAPGIDDKLIEELQKNIGPLYFAGESLLISSIGTMQAAYLSGKRAIQNILQKKNDLPQD